MSCNCNDIYPDMDMKRWSVCQSLDILTNYYTKAEVDEKKAESLKEVDKA